MKDQQNKARKQRKPMMHYPLRRCITMHDCCLCGQQISLRDQYRDGGLGRRAHQRCAVRERSARSIDGETEDKGNA